MGISHNKRRTYSKLWKPATRSASCDLSMSRHKAVTILTKRSKNSLWQASLGGGELNESLEANDGTAPGN